MFNRSPMAKSSAVNVSACFSTGTDSPVNADSSTFNDALSIKRKSAGTISPASKVTISPGTNSSLLTVLNSPSRKTVASGAAISFKALIASSALDSWNTPKTAFSTTTKRIITASTTSPVKAAIKAATNKTMIMKSLNCAKNFCSIDVVFCWFKALWPYCAKR